MKPAKFVCLWTLIALTVPLAGGAPAWSRIQGTAAESQTSIQSVAPQTITLTAGGPGVTVTMAGTSLGNITAVQVVQQGRPATGFEVRLSPSAGPTRAFDLKATGAVLPGDYRLRIIVRAQKWDLPAAVASVVVQEGASRSMGAKKQAATAVLPSKKAPEQAKVPKPARRSPDIRFIRAPHFNTIASDVFKDAYFTADACGGRDSERKTTANVPNAYFKQEPLDRMEYRFTDGQKDRAGSRRGGYHIRRVEIRACVDAWRLAFDNASIENGKFKVAFKFGEIQVITVRAMEERTTFGVYGGDMTWDWSDQDADNAIQNFRFSGGLEILLAPAAENGNISYQLEAARWVFYEPLTGWVGPGAFRIPEVEEPKIVQYKDRIIELIRQRIIAMFNDASVRAKLASALTQHAKSGDFAGRTIASVMGRDDTVEVTFQK